MGIADTSSDHCCCVFTLYLRKRCTTWSTWRARPASGMWSAACLEAWDPFYAMPEALQRYPKHRSRPAILDLSLAVPWSSRARSARIHAGEAREGRSADITLHELGPPCVHGLRRCACRGESTDLPSCHMCPCLPALQGHQLPGPPQLFPIPGGMPPHDQHGQMGGPPGAPWRAPACTALCSCAVALHVQRCAALRCGADGHAPHVADAMHTMHEASHRLTKV